MMQKLLTKPYGVVYEQHHNEQSLTESQFKSMQTELAENPLIASAAPIFAVITQLQQYQFKFKSMRLRNLLLQELSAFEKSLQQKSIDNIKAVSAKYILCAMLDEVILAQQQDGGSAWSQHSLISTFYKDAWGGEQFFTILDNALANPQESLDLLELILLCLQLGFAGKFQTVNNGYEKLSYIKRQILNCILSYKAINSQAVSMIGDAVLAKPEKKTFLSARYIAIGTVTLLATIYIVFNLQLDAMVSPLLQALQAGA